MTSLGVQITKRMKQSRERTTIQAGKLLLHNCIPLMVATQILLHGDIDLQDDYKSLVSFNVRYAFDTKRISYFGTLPLLAMILTSYIDRSFVQQKKGGGGFTRTFSSKVL